jgi:hypothetical protein
MGQSVLSELVTQYAEEGVCMLHVCVEFVRLVVRFSMYV